MPNNANLPSGFFDKVNYITDLWQDPCDAPWTVYVETALPHALELLVSATTFGGADVASQAAGFMEEAIEGYADPGGYNLFRRGLRGSRRGRFRNPLMDIPDRVARRAPGFNAIQGLTDNTGGKTFFTVFNLAERAQLQWFLANKAADEFIDWTTALYQTQKCSQAGAPRTGVSYVPRGTIPISGFLPTYLGGPDYAENGATMTNGIPGLAGQPGRAMASATVKSEETPFTFYMRFWTPGRGEITRTQTECPGGQECTLHLGCDVLPGEGVQPQIVSDGAFATGVKGFTKASGANPADGREFGNEWFGETF